MRSTERTWRRRIGCDVHGERTSGSRPRSCHHRPRRGPTSISASLWRRYSGRSSAGLLELLALDPRGRQLDQRGGARRREARGPASSACSSAANSSAVPRRRRRRRAAARRRSAASSATSSAGRAHRVVGDPLHAAGHRPVARRRTPRGGGRRAPRRSGGRSGAAGTRRGRGSGPRPPGCAAPGPSPWRSSRRPAAR